LRAVFLCQYRQECDRLANIMGIRNRLLECCCVGIPSIIHFGVFWSGVVVVRATRLIFNFVAYGCNTHTSHFTSREMTCFKLCANQRQGKLLNFQVNDSMIKDSNELLIQETKQTLSSLPWTSGQILSLRALGDDTAIATTNSRRQILQAAWPVVSYMIDDMLNNRGSRLQSC
jgi:hypothetical protein